jgi:hypothetical protein
MRLFLLGAMLSIFTTASFASMIITNGTFTVAGTIYVTGPGGVTIPGVGSCAAGFQCIFFQDTSTPATNGKLDILPLGIPNGDLPAGMQGLDAANVSSLVNPPDTPPSFPPVAFISFNNLMINTVLELSSFPLGINGAAGCALPTPMAGQLCTPPNSPFNLQNLSATSSIVSFKMGGPTLNGNGANWTGTFNAPFNNIPYQTILANLSATGFVQQGFTGQITLTPIPEPGSLSFLLLGSGMIVSATLLRRLSRR